MRFWSTVFCCFLPTIYPQSIRLLHDQYDHIHLDILERQILVYSYDRPILEADYHEIRPDFFEIRQIRPLRYPNLHEIRKVGLTQFHLVYRFLKEKDHKIHFYLWNDTIIMPHQNITISYRPC